MLPSSKGSARSGRVIIFGSFNCASAVGIFTHAHELKAPDKVLFEQGRSLTTRSTARTWKGT